MAATTLPALLLVYAEPGPNVSKEEFHDWYNNEHIPLRVKTPAFTSWTRWVATDNKQPTWAASYDLVSFESTQTSPYTSLAETRSEREKTLLANIGVMDRRIYEKYVGYPEHPPSELYDPTKPATIVKFVGIDPKPEWEEKINEWYWAEHTPMFSKVPGFIRGRRFVLKESVRIGVQAEGKQESAPKYLAVYEWASTDAFKTPEYRAALSTPGAQALVGEALERPMELREVKFYKNWERE